MNSAKFTDELLTLTPDGWAEMFARVKASKPRKALYALYMRSGAWRLNRLAALARAGSRCQDCKTYNALEVHHTTYERIGNEAAGDLIALCRECHEKRHPEKLSA